MNSIGNSGLQAQPQFSEGDVAVYANSRQAVSADCGLDEVYAATDGGVLRFDRRTGKLLDPRYTGIGWDRAVDLTGGRIILWHQSSNSLWLAVRRAGDQSYGLLYYRTERQRWAEAVLPKLTVIEALGDDGEHVIVDAGSEGRFWIDPLSAADLGDLGQTGNETRWQRTQRRVDNPDWRYFSAGSLYWFEATDAAVTDYTNRRYFPNFRLLDGEFRHSYISYPGLGVAVADERMLSVEMIETGPAVERLKGVALDGDSLIWTAGGGGEFSRLHRRSGSWERDGRDYRFGIESTNASAIVADAGNVWMATDQGIVARLRGDTRWTGIGVLDGLAGSSLRAIIKSGGYLVAGGDKGVNIIKIPNGPVWGTGDKRLDGFFATDMVADADTIWIGGWGGVFQGRLEGGWRLMSTPDQFGPDPALSLAVDANNLWVGSVAGISRYNRKSGVWTSHFGSVFLHGSAPLALTSVGGFIWIGTDRGLFRHNPDTGSWLEFGVNEGLPPGRINDIKIEADTLWMASDGGLVRFIWNNPPRDGG